MIFEFLIGVLSVIWLIYYFLKNCKKPEGFPPGPFWWPLNGSSTELRQLSKLLGGLHLAIEELSKKYDTNVLGLKFGNEEAICVLSYPVVKQVQTSEEYEGRPDNFFFRLRTMGTRKGITSTDGPLWKEQRSFMLTHLRNLGFGKRKMEMMVQQEMRDLLQKIEDNIEDLDFEQVLPPAVLNVLWTMTSGSRLDTGTRLKNLLQLLKKRAGAFDMSGGMLIQYPWLRHIMPEKTGYNLVQSLNVELKKFIMEVITKHKKTWTEGNRDDLIYSFLTEMHKTKDDPFSNFTDDQLVMICLDIFIAGSHTTSNTINFIFYMMILHPEVQAKVQKCLDEAFGKDEEILFADKQRVPFVEAVIAEVERFRPVVPISGPRRVLKSTTLDGYTIPEGTTVLISLHSVHSDKEYWGDPEVFRPERFLDENGNLVTNEQLFPFGVGKRKCPGDILAKTCIFLFCVEVLRRYKIEAKSGTKLTGKAVPGMIMAPEKYRAKFLKRN